MRTLCTLTRARELTPAHTHTHTHTRTSYITAFIPNVFGVRWCEDVDIRSNTVKFDLDITCNACPNGEMTIAVDVSDAVDPTHAQGVVHCLQHAMDLVSKPDAALSESTSQLPVSGGASNLAPNNGSSSESVDTPPSTSDDQSADAITDSWATKRALSSPERDLTLPRGVWEARVHSVWSDLLG